MQLQQPAQFRTGCLGHAAKRPRPARTVVVCSGDVNGTKAKTSIQKLIDSDGGLLIPGVYDALSARILEKSGHKAGFVSGAALSATMLGEPDLGLLSPQEMAERTGQICSAVPDVAVVADADTGGGSVLSVQRTIRQLIAAGARGCIIEDQVWPKRMGNTSKEVVSMEEFVGKLVAARDAIGAADFFLVARTDARGTSAKNGLEDAIRRANLYIDAGADASLVEAPRGVDELRMIADETKGIRVCNMLEGGVTPMAPYEELNAMGFHIVLHPLTGLYAATRALLDSYKSLAEHGNTTQEALKQMVSWREFNGVVGMEERMEAVRKYAKGQGLTQQRLTVRVRAPSKPVALGPYSEWPRREP